MGGNQTQPRSRRREYINERLGSVETAVREGVSKTVSGEAQAGLEDRSARSWFVTQGAASPSPAMAKVGRGVSGVSVKVTYLPISEG